MNCATTSLKSLSLNRNLRMTVSDSLCKLLGFEIARIPSGLANLFAKARIVGRFPRVVDSSRVRCDFGFALLKDPEAHRLSESRGPVSKFFAARKS